MRFEKEWCSEIGGEAIRSNRPSELSPAVRELADVRAELAYRQLNRQALTLEGSTHSEQKRDRE